MRKFPIIISTVLLLMLSCCKPKQTYDITASILDKNADTAYLYIYEPLYKSIRMLDKKPIYSDKKVRFDGAYTSSKVAFMKIGDDTVSYYFVLDSVNTSLIVGNRRMGIEYGSNSNKRYLSLYEKVEILRKNKITYQKSYWHHLRDSSMTAEKEVSIIKDFDRTEKRLQNLILRSINSNFQESYITWRKFGKYLPENLVPTRYKKAED